MAVNHLLEQYLNTPDPSERERLIEQMERHQLARGDLSFTQVEYLGGGAPVQLRIPDGFLEGDPIEERRIDWVNFNENPGHNSVWIMVDDGPDGDVRALALVSTMLLRGSFNRYSNLSVAVDHLRDLGGDLTTPSLRLTPEHEPEIVIAVNPSTQLDLARLSRLCDHHGITLRLTTPDHFNDALATEPYDIRLLGNQVSVREDGDQYEIVGIDPELLISDGEINNYARHGIVIPPYLRGRMERTRRWQIAELSRARFSEDDFTHTVRSLYLLDRMLDLTSRVYGTRVPLHLQLTDAGLLDLYQLIYGVGIHDIGEGLTVTGDVAAADNNAASKKEVARKLEERALRRAINNGHLAIHEDKALEAHFQDPSFEQRFSSAYTHLIDTLAGAAYVEANTNWIDTVQLADDGVSVVDKVLRFALDVMSRSGGLADRRNLEALYALPSSNSPLLLSHMELRDIAFENGITLRESAIREFELRCKRLGGPILELIRLVRTDEDQAFEELELIPIVLFVLQVLAESAQKNTTENRHLGIIFYYMFLSYINQQSDNFLFASE